MESSLVPLEGVRICAVGVLYRISYDHRKIEKYWDYIKNIPVLTTPWGGVRAIPMSPLLGPCRRRE